MRAGTVLLGFLAGVACGTLITVLVLGDPAPERARPAPAAGAGAREVSLPAQASEPGATSGTAAPAPAERAEPRPAVAATPAVDDRVGLVVYGIVSETSGAPVAAAYERVRFLPESGPALGADLDEAGAYALARLRPGTWTVMTDLQGYRPTSATLQLDPALPATRFDIVVEPAARLLVLAFAPDDRPLLDELRDRLGEEGRSDNLRITAIATLGAPGVLRAEPGRVWIRSEVGEFFGPERAMSIPGPPLSETAGALGWLDVKAPLPVQVSLVLTGVVLATQRVEPGQREVAFRIAPEMVTATFAGLTARFVDGFTHAPLEGVKLFFNVAALGAYSVTSDAEGVAQADRLLPGRVDFDAQREGYEMLATHVELATGQHTDLGDVPLLPATTVSGLVLDAGGQPLATDLVVTALDASGPFPVDLSGWGWSSHGDGTFEVGPLGRRRYTLRVASETLVSAPVFVDARGGDVSGLVLHAEVGQDVSIHIAWPPSVRHDMRLVSADGGFQDEMILISSPNVLTRRLTAGRYVAECCDGPTVLQSVPFDVTDRPVTVTLSGP